MMARPLEVWSQDRIDLFLLVVAFMNDHQGSPPPIDWLSQKTNRAKSHVYHNLNVLVEAGALSWQESNGIHRHHIGLPGGQWFYVAPDIIPPDVRSKIT